jgi:cytochrome c oxidase subunit 3
MSSGKAASTHHHPAHHYKDAEHEFVSSKLGIWLFLCTEILMFGGLFVGYTYYHALYSNVFAEGAKYLDWELGALNTVVLLVSSYTMAMGIHHAQNNNTKKCVINLWITLGCAFMFLCVKYIEYSHKIHIGALPGDLFHLAAPHNPKLPLYFSFYFCMTGLHATHVIAGMALIYWVLRRAKRGEFSHEYYTPLEGVGLFWHLVDLIWIYLFPLLYLIG